MEEKLDKIIELLEVLVAGVKLESVASKNAYEYLRFHPHTPIKFKSSDARFRRRVKEAMGPITVGQFYEFNPRELDKMIPGVGLASIHKANKIIGDEIRQEAGNTEVI